MSAGPVFERFRGLGTSIVVGAADPAALPRAVEIVRAEVDACDRSCSRFRDDSELSRLNAGERPAVVSEWLCEAVATAVEAARATEGIVDPTIGQCLIDLGYDRTFEQLDLRKPLVVRASHVPAWRQVVVDRQARRVSIPKGIRLDLGATAKALCADRAARSAAREAGSGVLVSLGGDIAVAGEPPQGGWVIRVTDRSDTEPDAPVPGQTVTIVNGGLATSGTTARRWSGESGPIHHLVDPRTGGPAEEAWQTVSVAAPTCVAANTASTAAIILGAAALDWLRRGGHDARLVSRDGRVASTGGWPADFQADPQEVPA